MALHDPLPCVVCQATPREDETVHERGCNPSQRAYQIEVKDRKLVDLRPAKLSQRLAGLNLYLASVVARQRRRTL